MGSPVNINDDSQNKINNISKQKKNYNNENANFVISIIDKELSEFVCIYKFKENILKQDRLNNLEKWTAENIHEVIQNISKGRNIGFGKVGQPFRLAISGDGNAGSIDKYAQLVGKERVLLRLKMAIDWIDNLPS